MDTPRTPSAVCRRLAARGALALAVGGVLVLGPSAALAQAPGAPAPAHVGVLQHGVDRMGHTCPSMDVPWL